jgi:putative transposase
MLIFGQRHLRAVLARYETHHNARRPHRSRQLRPPRPDHPLADLSRERIKRRSVLGGLTDEYERVALADQVNAGGRVLEPHRLATSTMNTTCTSGILPRLASDARRIGHVWPTVVCAGPDPSVSGLLSAGWRSTPRRRPPLIQNARSCASSRSPRPAKPTRALRASTSFVLALARRPRRGTGVDWPLSAQPAPHLDPRAVKHHLKPRSMVRRFGG